MRQPAQRLWPTLPHLRRRWFLGALLTGGPLGWMARTEAVSAARSASAGRKQPTTRVDAAPEALVVFIDHLLPADEWTPAASALGVPKTIWREAHAEHELLAFVRGGCQWLDRYGDGFAALTEDEREALCQWMSRAGWETPQRRFFHWVRERAFTLYYTQSASWRGMPFDRPPQPIGFSEQRGL